MSDFERLFKNIIKHEGYYANVPGDKGGETYMGIARNIHPDWKGWKYIDDYKKNVGRLKRNQKIESISLDTLVEIFYYEKYYLANGINLINNFNLKYIIFDWCVNSGVYGAKNVQRIVGVEQHGIIGKKTAKAINESNAMALFFDIKNARVEYYHAISKKGQNYKFLDGWLARINSIKWND